MHPFTPIPLLLCARYGMSHYGSNDVYSNLVISITRALEGLSTLNSLAQDSLRGLGLNFQSFPVGL